MRTLILFILATISVEAPAATKKLAVLVGVNKYKRRGFNQLEFAERDVTEVGRLLKKQGFKVRLLTGNQATAKNIRDACKQH